MASITYSLYNYLAKPVVIMWGLSANPSTQLILVILTS